VRFRYVPLARQPREFNCSKPFSGKLVQTPRRQNSITSELATILPGLQFKI
jgi:hypothetical protein